MKFRVLIYCVLGGVPMLIAAMGLGSPLQTWIAGVVMAAAFVPIALFGPRGFFRQFAVIFPVLLTITCVCTWSEAYLFMPSALGPRPLASLGGELFMYAIVGVALALLAVLLKTTRDDAQAVASRPFASRLFLVLLCGIGYAIYYFVFGTITYRYFTHSYYPEAQKIAMSLGLWFWVIQVVRGMVMTLGVLPAIHTLRMPRGQAAVAIGLLIWVAGGLAPLLLPGIGMGTAQRVIHTVEIFTQNFPLGVTAVLLLRPKV
jgi:hypothetical protein